ncbi:hypothetical protein [Geodermatophilus sp. SYSU D01119]
MTRDHAFDGVLEPLAWGCDVHLVIRVPAELEAARAEPTRRVEGRIDDVAVDLGLDRAEPAVLADAFVHVGPGLRRRLGLDPGEVRPAGSARPTPTPSSSPTTCARRWRTAAARPPPSG